MAPPRSVGPGKGGTPLRAAIAKNADRHAADLAAVVQDGRTSLGAIADELNARGMLSPVASGSHQRLML